MVRDSSDFASRFGLNDGLFTQPRYVGYRCHPWPEGRVLIKWIVNSFVMTLDNTIILPDQRLLGYAAYGDPSGFPVFYFPGGQESRLSAQFMEDTVMEMGIRMVVPERPGIGLSSFQPNRRFQDWPSDILELADNLRLDRFSIFGLSGGAPHVLSCLTGDTSRIVSASVVAGAAPYSYRGSLKGMWFPVKLLHWFARMKNDKWLRKFIEDDFKALRDKPEQRLKQFQRFLPKPDKELMRRNPAFGWDFIKGSLESYKQGIDGVVQEWQLYVSDWEIEVGEIHFPVSLWYGTADVMAPPARGRYYEKNLPQARLHLENEGHFSLIRNHLRAILSDLLPAS